jgi:O-antigen/teichoic acid export membrane protein
MLAKINYFKNNAAFIRYLKNTCWIIGEQYLRIITGLFVGIWVARYLGPEQFGQYSYAFAFTAIFGGIAKLGLDGIMVRELVNHPEMRDTYLGTAFWLKVIGAFVVMGSMVAIVPFTNNDTTTNLFIFIITAGLIFQSFEVVEFYFQSQVLAKLVAICKVIQLALSSMIKIYLLLNEAELIYFVVVTTFDMLSLAVSYYVAYKVRENLAFYKYFDIKIAKQLLKYSWPLIFSSIVVSVYMRIDQIMIKEMLGEHEVGIYSAAVRLSEAFYFIPVLITASLFPAILNAKNQSEELYRIRMQRLYTLMVWLAIAIAVPMSFLADWLILLLFGHEYKDAGQVLMIHIWSSIFVFIGVAASKWVIAENFLKNALLRTSMAALLNIVLNIILIKWYGVLGAAVGTLLSMMFANFISLYFWGKTRPCFYAQLRGFYDFKNI